MPWSGCCVLLVLSVCPLVVHLLLLSPCPPDCCCLHPGRLVLCESLGLRALPGSVPLSTSGLSVARNKLCNVDHLFRPFSGLQELSLSHNQLTRFPRGLPPSLENLRLQENRITYITSGALQHLGNLSRLGLEDNRIRAIQPAALWGLNKLQVLSLKGNRLTSLPAKLPPSLAYLDLSANCITAIDRLSVSSLVNLQIFKINSNCLRSVPESAFDGLLRLRSVDLGDNHWVCECDILYLYRWLVSGRLKMATDLVCTEPYHLAHHLLLNLSVGAICPLIMKPHEGNKPGLTSLQSSLDNKTIGKSLGQSGHTSNNTNRYFTMTNVYPPHISLETLSYKECLSLNLSPVSPESRLRLSTPVPQEDSTCLGSTARKEGSANNSSSTQGNGPYPSTNKAGFLPTPGPEPDVLHYSAVVIALLAFLCVFVALTMLAVLLVLKITLNGQRRVAPHPQSQS